MGKGKHANTLRRQCSLAALLLAAGSAAAEQVGERWRANGSRNNGTERAAQAEVVARFEGQHGRMPMGWQIQSRDIYSSEIRVLYVPVPVPARIDPWYFRFGDELFLNEAEMNDYIVERTPGDEGCRPTRGAGIEWHQGDLDTQWRAMQEPGSLRLLVTKRDKQTDECLTRPQYASVERKRGVHCLPPLLTDDMLQMCALRRPQDDFALYYFGPLSQRNCDGVGNPCNPSTGDKFQREIDLDLPWMRWTRNYHSLQPTMEAPFGPGWSHDHNVRLVLDGNGMPVGLVDDDGSQRSLPLSLYTNDDSGDRVRVLRDGWELLRSDERVEFNRRGQLRARYFNDGRVLLYEYSRSGRLVIIGDGTGREVEIGYDASGRINRVLQDGHQLLGYRYQQGRLVAVVHADATQRTYHYEDERHPDHLTGITAEDGRRFGWYAYDDKGRVVCSQHSAGCDDDIPGLDGVRLAYPDDGTTVVRDALGRRSVYHWEQLNGQNAKRLVALVDDGGTQRRRYERPGLLAEVVDRRGTSTSYRRTETAGQRTLTVVEAEYTSAERLATYHTDKQTNRLLQSIQTGRDTRYTYNARLQPVQIVEQGQSGGAQRVIRIEYCETNAPACGYVGQMRSVTFAPGSTIRYAYYTADAAGCSVSAFTCSHRRGDLHTVTDAAGLSITHEAYDASGRVLRERDANGVLTEREWHPRGWLSRVTVHGSMPEQNRTTRFNWTPLGDLQQVIEPGGHTLTWIYNNARHLTDIVSSEGSSISYTLDLQGNRTGEAITDAQGTLRHALARTFDLMGNVTASLDAYGHVIRYATDAEGNTVSLTDALGRVTDWSATHWRA